MNTNRLTQSMLAIIAITAMFLLAGAVVQAQTRVVDGTTIKPGYPLPADGQRLLDDLKLNRAIELFLWSLPVNQTYAGRDGILEASGGGLGDINYIGDFITIKPLIISQYPQLRTCQDK